MASPAFEDYRARALNEGYDEVLVRSWPADLQIVVSGEMWLTVGSETRHLLPGDEFELAAAARHAERYGHTGAAFWLARRNPSAE
ncbi:MAG: hypothetical protein RLZZ300_528 [Pseudomonadota bacterium]